eukprot:GHVU01074501.1.p2 GENE.GHVU01074501.1~~GHVU01074501.1.p2  ORF type:complete len:107 (+),score=9.42 GHVU01074501.1:378-698(+)
MLQRTQHPQKLWNFVECDSHMTSVLWLLDLVVRLTATIAPTHAHTRTHTYTHPHAHTHTHTHTRRMHECAHNNPDKRLHVYRECNPTHKATPHTRQLHTQGVRACG